MREPLTVGSLFAGIGGFDLGLERAGMRVIWQSEIDPYACAVLRKHWPTVPNLGDIRGITDAERPDVICGGFPCQPYSRAARGANKDDNLWREMHRVICENRPAWVVCENVVALDRMALNHVATDLETSGYEVGPPFVIPACAVGHDHKRERLWILGHSTTATANQNAPSMQKHPGCRRLEPITPEGWERRMGYPIGWTALDVSATPSSRKSRKSSAGQS